VSDATALSMGIPEEGRQRTKSGGGVRSRQKKTATDRVIKELRSVLTTRGNGSGAAFCKQEVEGPLMARSVANRI